MPFSVRNLSVLAYANGFTLWHYKAAEGGTLDAACRDGFFDPASDMLAGGDIIMISAPQGARIMSIGAGAEGGRVLRPVL